VGQCDEKNLLERNHLLQLSFPPATAPPDLNIKSRQPSARASPAAFSLRVRRRPRVPISQRAGADHLVGQVSLLTSPEGGALFLLLSDGPFRRRQCGRTPAVL
jgi:hypothetical protein